MPVCDETKLLLGPFDDGELEPHEMEDVAFHIVGCAECKSALGDYRALGVALRDVAPQPSLDGFAQAVQARIERIPAPINVRIRRRFGSWAESIGAAIAMGVAGAAAAVITVAVVTPYAQRFARHDAAPLHYGPPSNVVALTPHSVPPPNIVASAPQAGSAMRPEDAVPDGAIAKVVAQAEDNATQSSQAVISQLEAESPSVALWNEPQTETTVIWVPNQP
jgi:hypothetical protein